MRIKWRGLELPNRLTSDRETLTDTYGKFYAEPFDVMVMVGAMVFFVGTYYSLSRDAR